MKGLFLRYIWFRNARPRVSAHDEATQAAFRQSLVLPKLHHPLPDAARLNRIADEALRVVRRRAVADPGFTWLLAPRVAAGLVAMAIAGGAVGANWPVPQPAPAIAAPTDAVALLDIPLATPADVSP